jgi:hypothetical protein
MTGSPKKPSEKLNAAIEQARIAGEAMLTLARGQMPEQMPEGVKEVEPDPVEPAGP